MVMVVRGPSYSGLLRCAVFMGLPWFPLEASFPLGWARTYHVLWGMRAEGLSSSLSRPAPPAPGPMPHPAPSGLGSWLETRSSGTPSCPTPGSLSGPAPPKTDPSCLPAGTGEAFGARWGQWGETPTGSAMNPRYSWGQVPPLPICTQLRGPVGLGL